MSRNDTGLSQRYKQQAEEKRKAGRFNLEEAVKLIAAGGYENEELMLAKLVADAGTGTLPTYMSGSRAKNEYQNRQGRFKSPNIFYDECYWDDLNKWLDDNERRISYRFAPPEGTPHQATPEHTSAPENGKVKARGGRPRVNGKKAEKLRRLIEAMTAGKTLNTCALPGSAANLLDACQRIEKARTGKAATFGGSTAGTFDTLLKTAGYSVKKGRTPIGEKTYWTDLCVKTIGKMPVDVFT